MHENTSFHTIIRKAESIRGDDEANGGVSFFPTKKQCEALLPNYCSGGEWKESVVQMSLKRIARMQKRRYAEFKDLYIEFTGSTSEPVILEVHLPREWIANTHVLGTKSEHYTLKKVPMTYVKKVHRYPRA